MKSTALIMAVVGIAAGAAWAVPTYTYTAVDLGGGLYGFTFSCDNVGQPASAWFAEMEWRGMTQAEVDQHCQWWPAIPGTIIQSNAFGVIPVHCECIALDYDLHDPTYDMSRDTWITEEFCHAFSGGTPIEGANSFYVECGTAAGMQYVAVDHAYVVVDGSFAYEGRLGVGLVDPVWTPFSGYICIPEPATIGMLVLGGLALVRRRRRQALA